MSATDELRRMLTEAGVEWREEIPNKTKWYHGGVEYVATNAWPRNDATHTKLVIHAILTPAQAIAATVGTGTLTAEQVSNATYAHSIHADCADADWQAIADELNDTLGRGMCHKVLDFDGTAWICSECGEHIGPRRWNFCPNCGRKVVDE